MESTINTLKYGNVEIAVADRGSELRSYKVDGEEFMWDRKPEFWAASSPVLFPFVGTIKNGAYSFNGKKYKKIDLDWDNEVGKEIWYNDESEKSK